MSSTTQQLQLPLASSSSTATTTATSTNTKPSILSYRSPLFKLKLSCNAINSVSLTHTHRFRHFRPVRVGVNGDYGTSSAAVEEDEDDDEDEEEEEVDPTPDDLENISQIKRVLELLRRNRDMLYGEVKLTIMIEDPREVERKRLLGIDDSDGPTREDLVAALEDVNEGKVPRNRVALQMLAEEMTSWPNLEAEPSRKQEKTKSLYAKATDTGIDPKVAAKRLNVEWDSAAEIADVDTTDDNDVPPALGYGALYLVTAFPVIIGISVVLILFYNSLQ